MVDLNGLEMTGMLHDPKNMLARGGVTGPVWMTMVNGEVVVKEGRLTKVDEEKLVKEGEAVCNKALRDQFPAIW